MTSCGPFLCSFLPHIQALVQEFNKGSQNIKMLEKTAFFHHSLMPVNPFKSTLYSLVLATCSYHLDVSYL